MKKLDLILVLILSVAISGCGTTKDSTTPNNAAGKDSASATTDAKAADKVSTADVQYGLTKVSYSDQNIKINYLQITNLSDSDKQQKINNLIKTAAMEVLNDYKDSLSSLSLTMDYEVKYQGADLLSIVYLGLANVKDAAYPVHLIQTTNIDLQKGERLVISEIVNVDDSFGEKILAGQYKAYSSDLNLEPAVVKDVLQGYGGHSMALLFHPFTAKFYLTKDSLGVSIEVEHALGDHLELEMPYTSLGEFLLKTTRIGK